MKDGNGQGKELGEFFIRVAEDQKLREEYLGDPPGVLRKNQLARYADMIESGDVNRLDEELRSAYPDIILGTIVIGQPPEPGPPPPTE